MKKKLKYTALILLGAVVVFATVWIIKTKMNAPSEEQLKKEKQQDDTLYQGDGGKLDQLDQLVSDESDTLGKESSGKNP